MRFLVVLAVREKTKILGALCICSALFACGLGSAVAVTLSKTCVFRLVLALQSEEHLRPILAQKVSGKLQQPLKILVAATQAIATTVP